MKHKYKIINAIKDMNEIEKLLKTKSKWYLEDCIKNKTNDLLAQRILNERQK